MDFRTYKQIAYVGMVVFPFAIFGLIYARSQSLSVALGLTFFLTLILTPLQLWQLGQLQTRLDEHDGSIPLGWAWGWTLEDSSDDTGPDDYPPTSDSAPPRRCPACQHLNVDPSARFCSRCGAPL